MVIAGSLFFSCDEFFFWGRGRKGVGEWWDLATEKFLASFNHLRYLSQAKHLPKKHLGTARPLPRGPKRKADAADEVCCLLRMRSWCPATLFTTWTLPSMTPRLFLSGWWQLKYFEFSPYLGKIPNLTNIFQRGWNHQPVVGCVFWLFCFFLESSFFYRM